MVISIAVVPSFSGLRHFPEGRGFTQWTGDDSKALMKVSIPISNSFNSLIATKGLFAGYRRACPWWYRAHFSGISWVLLHCLKGRNHRPNASRASWRTCPIPPVSRDIPHSGCPPRRIFTSSSTLPCSLRSPHQAIWRSEWPLYINHQIKTYQSGKGALEALQ